MEGVEAVVEAGAKMGRMGDVRVASMKDMVI